jgi:hypothetical protein
LVGQPFGLQAAFQAAFLSAFSGLADIRQRRKGRVKRGLQPEWLPHERGQKQFRGL